MKSHHGTSAATANGKKKSATVANVILKTGAPNADGADKKVQSPRAPRPEYYNTAPELSPAAKEQLRDLLRTVKAVRAGEFSVRLPVGHDGIISEIGEVLNDIIELNENMASEFVRVREI